MGFSTILISNKIGKVEMAKSEKIHNYQSDQYFSDDNPVKVIFYRQGENGATYHNHDFYEIAIVLSGSGYHKTLHNKIPFSKGSIFFMDIGEPHGYQIDEEFDIINCLFHPDYLEKIGISGEALFPKAGYEAGVHLDPESEEFETIVSELKKIDEEQQSDNSFKVEVISHMFATVVLRIQREFAKLTVNEKFSEQARIVKEYINENLSDEIKIDQIAQAASLAPSYLSRHFKEITGYNLTELINECRIQKACLLLQESGADVETLWQDIGYKSKVYFYRSFKKVTGTTPVKYKKQYS